MDRNGTPAPRTALLLHVREQRPHAPGYQRLLDELNEAALAAIRAAGWRAELLPTATVDERVVLERARAADAVVIMGGEDVDPRRYGGRSDYPGSGHHEPESDAALVAVVLDAIDRAAPLLAICRGHQLLNVALGGTLIEHLEGHRSDGAEHFVTTAVEGAPQLPRPALCTHHQAIRDLGEGLRVLARADDGVIEAVGHETAPVLGVQWHPEHPRVAAEQLPALLELVTAKRPAW